VTGAAAVKVAPQQRKALPGEVREERRKVRDDQGREAARRKGRPTISEAQRLSDEA
jgi:hypothetical protein